MADTNDRVMAMVEEELQKNPDASNEELYEKARKMDKSVEQLTARQFNARYPLQVKRRRAPKRRRGGGAKKKAAAKRGRRAAKPAKRGAKRGAKQGARGGQDVREILLEFAKELSSADDMSDVVAVIGNIDAYVERIEKAKSR